MNTINETSLSRVWQHFKNDNTVVIMTAFRGDKTYQENLTNNKKVANIFKSNKFGYFFVDGYWIENKGENDEMKVSEDSIFVITEPSRSDELIDLAFKEAKRYNQDAIFVKTKDDVYLYFKDGSKSKLTGGLQPGKVGDFYTQLRNNKESNTFVFESARENYGFFGNYAVHMNEKAMSFDEWANVSLEQTLDESSLSRLWKFAKEHDTGTISAFRSKTKCNEGEKISKAENLKRSKILKAKLLKLGYGVTKIYGVYIENYGSDTAVEVNEESYFVVDLKDSKRLKKDLITLGQEFEQDSITYSKATGEYYLISSNECPDGYPGKGKDGVEVKLGTPMFGDSGEFHSKINGRPFVFKSAEDVNESITNFYPTEIRSILKLAE